MKYAIICKRESVFLFGKNLGLRVFKVQKELIEHEDDEFFVTSVSDEIEEDTYYWDKYYMDPYGNIRDVFEHKPKQPTRPVLESNKLNVIA